MTSHGRHWTTLAGLTVMVEFSAEQGEPCVIKAPPPAGQPSNLTEPLNRARDVCGSAFGNTRLFRPQDQRLTGPTSIQTKNPARSRRCGVPGLRGWKVGVLRRWSGATNFLCFQTRPESPHRFITSRRTPPAPSAATRPRNQPSHELSLSVPSSPVA